METPARYPISVQEVADIIGVSKPTIYKYINPNVPFPNRPEIIKEDITNKILISEDMHKWLEKAVRNRGNFPVSSTENATLTNDAKGDKINVAIPLESEKIPPSPTSIGVVIDDGNSVQNLENETEDGKETERESIEDNEINQLIKDSKPSLFSRIKKAFLNVPNFPLES